MLIAFITTIMFVLCKFKVVCFYLKEIYAKKTDPKII